MPRVRHCAPKSMFSQRLLVRTAVLVMSLLFLLTLLNRVYQNPQEMGEMLHQFVAVTAEGTKPGAPHGNSPRQDIDEGDRLLEFAALEAPEGVDVKPGLAPLGRQEDGQVNPLDLKEIGSCREIDRSLFGQIKDKSPGQPKELPAIYQMLCVAATTPPETLAALSRRDVFFVNLFNDPDLYRGKPIHIKGVLSRLTAREDLAAKNPYGISKVYEAWIFTEEQIQNPTIVLLSSIPEGLKPSMELRENVTLNAFFFKLFAFQTGDSKWHAAPMLIGYDMQWIRVAEGTGTAEALTLGVGFVLVLTVAATVFWWLSRRDDGLSDQFHSMVKGVTKPDDAPFAPDLMFESPSEPEAGDNFTIAPDDPKPSA